MERSTRLKRRRRAKPRPLDDTGLYEEYGRQNWFCEWAFYLGITVVRGQLSCGWEGRTIDAAARNHIYSLSRRPDTQSNLISLTAEAHDWFHANLPKGRLLCIAAKLKKQAKLGVHDEFVLDEINDAAGRNIEGVIQGLDFQDALFWKLQEETSRTLTRLKALENERRDDVSKTFDEVKCRQSTNDR